MDIKILLSATVSFMNSFLLFAIIQTMYINKELEEIISLLEANKFVKAHDVLEKLWREYKNDETTREESFILKAFVNASVSFEIYKMHRFSHYENIWNTFKKYEPLIDEINSLNQNKYKQIQKIIYKKREHFII